MKKTNVIRVAAAGAAIGVMGYAVLAGSAWARFGRPPRARTLEEEDPLLDGFIPTYDVVERHHVMVEAPAAVTLECARNLDMAEVWLSRAIFKARELILGADTGQARAGGLVPVMLHLGWGVLAEQAGHEIVLGAITRPWEPNPVFRSVPASDFATFREPGSVKIAFTLRADPVTDHRSIFRSETRAIATDPNARRLFRRYWSMVSPGVALIRVAMLNPIRAAAERSARGPTADADA